jgi:hypothetical protein
VHSDNVDKHD